MLRNSHILITGANGFLGRHLCTALIETGARVSQLVRSKVSTFQNEEVQIALDLTDRKKVAEIFSARQPDYVIHLAGSKSRNASGVEFRDSYSKNLSVSLNVIDACLGLRYLKRLVFLGSCDEYGPISSPFEETQREMPANVYGLTKLAITKMLSGLYQLGQFPSVVLRPSVIYGPRQGSEMFFSALIQNLLAGKDFPMTAGEQYRDFVYVSDVVEAIIRATGADEVVNGKVFNIGAGKSYRIKDIAELTAQQIGARALEQIKFGAVPYRINEVMDYSVDIAQAQVLLGWHPKISLEVGLQQTIQHYKATIARRKI